MTIPAFPDDTFPGTTGEPFWFLGGRSRILLPGSTTNGALSVMEFLDTASHAPPLHVHEDEDEDEVWIVLTVWTSPEPAGRLPVPKQC